MSLPVHSRGEFLPLNSMGIDSICVQFCEAAHTTGLVSGCADIGSLLPSPPEKNYFQYLVHQNLYLKYLDVCLDSQITAKILELILLLFFF